MTPPNEPTLASRLLAILPSLGLVLMVALCGVAHAQSSPAWLLAGYSLKARLVYYAPDASHLLVTLCESLKEDAGCHPWRYQFQTRTWEKVKVVGEEPDWSIHSATYSPDGKTIAISYVKCLDRTPRDPLCPLVKFRVGLVDAASGAMRQLPPSEQGA